MFKLPFPVTTLVASIGVALEVIEEFKGPVAPELVLTVKIDGVVKLALMEGVRDPVLFAALDGTVEYNSEELSYPITFPT